MTVATAAEVARTAADVIVVRGPSGSGKSSLLTTLPEVFTHGATIEIDALRGMINNVDWWAATQHAEAAAGATDLALHYLAAGHRPVVLGDTFPSRILRLVIDRLGASARMEIISLCASTAVLARRLCLRHKGHRRSAAALRVAHSMVAACEPWGLLHRQALPSGIDAQWKPTPYDHAAAATFRGVPFYSIDTTNLTVAEVMKTALGLLEMQGDATPHAHAP